MEALAPFRAPFSHPEGDPQPLPYLSSAANSAQGGLDIELEALILTDKMRAAGAAPERITRTNYKHAYWTAAQMVTHHTVNGCNLRPGDLLGTGTLSGPTLDQACALIELTTGGKNPIQLANGESRTWLEDGDTIVLRGWCQKEGAARIGFGECVGTVLPAAA
jgi:fumarylacetoacetase